MHPLHDIVLQDLRTDVVQMAEEGHDVAALQREVEAARATGSFDALIRLQEALWNRPSPPGFAYREPNDWPSIAAHFPDPESHARFRGTDADLADRLLAAWQGRCAGCQLGKPLEGPLWPHTIKSILQAVGSWPLTDYMNPPPQGVAVAAIPDCTFFEPGQAWRSDLCRGRFDHVAPDDDIHYALVSQRVLEAHGSAFTAEQALAMLHQQAPISCLFAAGRNMFRTSVFGVPTPCTAVMGNPCRQSLGAQIRCDPFGWGAPANPALAAQMAYRDATNSQIRNGIYSGIFFAVLLADTLAHGDPVRAIGTASRYVPPHSRFAEMIRYMQAACAAADDWEAINTAMIARYHAEANQFNHAIPNAAIVILGLLKGRGDFTRTLGITVMAGLDTDCTGATVGSILGCALGTAGIPSTWTAPFHDTIRSQMRDMPEVRISEVARRMFEVARPHVRRA